MKTEQLWFRMSSTAHEKSCVVAMRMKLGWEGFGIYVGILSLLRNSEDGSLPVDFEQIGWTLRCPSNTVKSVVMDFGLFMLTDDGGHFFDQNLIDEMEQYQSALDERREAGRRSAERRWGTKADQNSNGNAMHDSEPPPKTTEKQAKDMGDPSKNVTGVTDLDAINKQIKKDTLNTSYCIKQSDASDSFDGGTPVGVGLPKNKIQDDFFNQLDDRWQAIMQRWYAHKKKLSPKFRNMKILKENFEYLTELSGGDIDCAEAIVDYSIKQCYSGLFKPAMGRGGKSAKPSKKKDVKYSNDAWGNSQENLPKVELKIDENGNPCPF
ncbi:MAG: DUF4373 domain-containing protein [Bacteroidales bacterium]|nr:DUF4373 domain-containing protein [Bacteroidales bacterium]